MTKKGADDPPRGCATTDDEVLPAAQRRAAIRGAQANTSLGSTCVSITAYGRNVEDGLRIAFGDDITASGRLGLVFADDAIADPISGLTAARTRQQLATEIIREWLE